MSAGMILLEMLTGQRAWMGLHYGQIIKQVGDGERRHSAEWGWAEHRWSVVSKPDGAAPLAGWSGRGHLSAFAAHWVRVGAGLRTGAASSATSCTPRHPPPPLLPFSSLTTHQRLYGCNARPHRQPARPSPPAVLWAQHRCPWFPPPPSPSGNLPMPIPTDIPPALASLVRRCLNRDPAQRPDFPTILAEVQQLKDVVMSRPTSAEGSRPEAASPPRRAERQQQQGKQQQVPRQLSPEERQRHKEKQQQLIREQEEWLARQTGQPAAAAQLVVVPPARAPSLASPFAAAPALAPASSLASPFAAAPERAPSLPQPAGGH